MPEKHRDWSPIHWFIIIFMVIAVMGSLLLKTEKDLDSCHRELNICEETKTTPIVYKEACPHTPLGPVPDSFTRECEFKCFPMPVAVDYHRDTGWKCLCDPDVGC